MKHHTITPYLLFVLLCFGGISNSRAQQYIYEVLEYTPAPGQFINKAPWGTPDAAQSIIGGINGSLSLGAWGGYVVFRFENPVINHPNHPYGIDFILFGNALSTWSEPGSVWVMKDENHNGIPDGQWYQLAGSDYHFSNTYHQYELRYYNPGTAGADVPWTDHLGNSGFIKTTGNHTQNYYPDSDLFPHISPDSLIFRGTRIDGLINKNNPSMIIAPPRAFGYADNRPRGVGPFHIPDNPYTGEREKAGADGFDISWAVDENGQYVDLDTIHFIKVQTAVLANASWQGEVSTEITGAIKTEPTGNLNGNMDLVVIKDLPPILTDLTLPLEGFAFHKGRIQSEAMLSWEVLTENAIINENQELTILESGPLEIKLSLTENPDVFAIAETLIDLDATGVVPHGFDPALGLFRMYPNPAQNHITLVGVEKASIGIYNANGNQVYDYNSVSDKTTIFLETFPSGVYFIRITKNQRTQTFKLIKH